MITMASQISPAACVFMRQCAMARSVNCPAPVEICSVRCRHVMKGLAKSESTRSAMNFARSHVAASQDAHVGIPRRRLFDAPYSVKLRRLTARGLAPSAKLIARTGWFRSRSARQRSTNHRVNRSGGSDGL